MTEINKKKVCVADDSTLIYGEKYMYLPRKTLSVRMLLSLLASTQLGSEAMHEIRSLIYFPFTKVPRKECLKDLIMWCTLSTSDGGLVFCEMLKKTNRRAKFRFHCWNN